MTPCLPAWTGSRKKGKIADYGVSIEKVSEGLKAMEYNISAIEVIFNMFRLKPAESCSPRPRPTTSASSPGTSGQRTADGQSLPPAPTFGPNDHRSYNRNGESFDKGRNLLRRGL